MRRLEHNSIVDLVKIYLAKHHPNDYIKKYFVYSYGEMDILRVHDKVEWNAYEIKSRDTTKLRNKAYEQLLRFQMFMARTLPQYQVRTYFVRPVGPRVTIIEIDYGELEKKLEEIGRN